MLYTNSISLNIPLGFRIYESLVLILDIIFCYHLIKEYENLELLFDDFILGEIMFLVTFGIFLSIAIFSKKRIVIKNNYILINFLPKIYKKLEIDEIEKISPVINLHMSILDKCWHGIFSEKNLYAITTASKIYYINCTDIAILQMETLAKTINTWNISGRFHD